jgi:hypothetical protein
MSSSQAIATTSSAPWVPSHLAPRLVLTIAPPQITLKDLDVTINTPAEAFAVQVQNNETVRPPSTHPPAETDDGSHSQDVVFKNPFAFSLQVAQAGGNFIVWVLSPLVRLTARVLTRLDPQ